MRRFTAIIEREDDGYVSFCPEFDIASQGGTVEEARADLREAIELILETASEEEICVALEADCIPAPARPPARRA